jgi:hypothetical protein
MRIDTESPTATVFTSILVNGSWRRDSRALEIDRKVLLACNRLLAGPLLLVKGKRPDWSLMRPPGEWDGKLPPDYLTGFYVPVQVEGVAGWLDWSSPSAYLHRLIQRLYGVWEERGSQAPLSATFNGFETRFNEKQQRDYYIPILTPDVVAIDP